MTPIRNEDWILERFLQVTSRFADHIIVADQQSTDRSASICRKYEKVTIVENQNPHYDEGSRQLLLLSEARRLVPGKRIILALDADEILAGNALATVGWTSMWKAPPGTVLCFEKPDLFVSPAQCIRYDVPWPVGYVDDGAPHTPKRVHSLRIPVPEGASRYLVHDVKILHYALARFSSQSAKHRLYSVVENVAESRKLFGRRSDYGKKISAYSRAGRLEVSPAEWFKPWEDLGIDMTTIVASEYYWQDFEVLRYFKEYGEQRFWKDDIWSFDWERCRKFALSQGVLAVSANPIQAPGKGLTGALSLLDGAYEAAKWLRSVVQRRGC